MLEMISADVCLEVLIISYVILSVQFKLCVTSNYTFAGMI